jgi:hypothetical protein
MGKTITPDTSPVCGEIPEVGESLLHSPVVPRAVSAGQSLWPCAFQYCPPCCGPDRRHYAMFRLRSALASSFPRHSAPEITSIDNRRVSQEGLCTFSSNIPFPIRLHFGTTRIPGPSHPRRISITPSPHPTGLGPSASGKPPPLKHFEISLSRWLGRPAATSTSR